MKKKWEVVWWLKVGFFEVFIGENRRGFENEFWVFWGIKKWARVVVGSVNGESENLS